MASQLNNSINNTPYATEEERQIALNKVKAIVDDANEKYEKLTLIAKYLEQIKRNNIVTSNQCGCTS